MKNNKKKLFSIYTVISFFTLLIFFFLYDNKSVAVYEIKKNAKEINLDIIFFDKLFNIKSENLLNISEKKLINKDTQFNDPFYYDIILNYNSPEYSKSINKTNNYYELFNEQLKKQLTISSFNSETVLKSYSHKNIPNRIYEVKIISKNPEDMQKFFEKNISQTIETLNNELIQIITYDYLNKKIRVELENQKNLTFRLQNMKECKEKIQDERYQQFFKTETRLLDRCDYNNNLILVENEIKKLEDIYNQSRIDILNYKKLNIKSRLKLDDFLYKSFIEIHKKKDVNNISYLNVFILYLLSLIFLWVLVFKTNYFNLLFNNKLFKLPK